MTSGSVIVTHLIITLYLVLPGLEEDSPPLTLGLTSLAYCPPFSSNWHISSQLRHFFLTNTTFLNSREAMLVNKEIVFLKKSCSNSTLKNIIND